MGWAAFAQPVAQDDYGYVSGGFPPPPSATAATIGLVGGFPPPPSANAAEANDNSNNATASIRFIVLLKFGNGGSAEASQANSLVRHASRGGFYCRNRRKSEGLVLEDKKKRRPFASLRTPPLIFKERSPVKPSLTAYKPYALAPTAAGSAAGTLSSLPLAFCWPACVGWPPLRMSMPPLK